ATPVVSVAGVVGPLLRPIDRAERVEIVEGPLGLHVLLALLQRLPDSGWLLLLPVATIRRLPVALLLALRLEHGVFRLWPELVLVHLLLLGRLHLRLRQR